MCKLFLISILLTLGLSWASIAVAETDFSFERKLVPTDQGEDVKRLQELLKSQGVCDWCTATGYFGHWTQVGLLNLQEKYGLATTGVVDEKTRTKLNELLIPLDVKLAELKEQIAALLEQLDALKAQEETVPEIQAQVLFSIPLALGMKGEEVRRLQEALAKDPEVYPEGLVTGYFGFLTLAAVTRFQEKYAEDVLAPIGLPAGTGFVGERTLGKLNELYASRTLAKAEPEPLSSEAPQGAKEEAPAPAPLLPPAPDLSAEALAEADTTPPSAITSISSPGFTASSIQLSWTAPGDDGNTGTAASYDVRYVTPGIITNENWATATKVTGEPAPKAAGTLQTMTVSGLVVNTTYYFAIKTVDEASNESSFSSVTSNTTNLFVSPTGGASSSSSLSTSTSSTAPTPSPAPPTPDTTAPAAVTNLTAPNPGPSSIGLSWPAPGDDAYAGTATSYDVRYSTSTITESNWALATQATGEPAPKAGGVRQAMTIAGLAQETTYYFALKTSDEVPNTSSLSNVATAKTVCRTTATGKQTYFVSTQTVPQIMQVDLDPLDVAAGATQTVTVKIRDTNNNAITQVSGTANTDGGTKTFALSRIAGDDLNGTWQGTWSPSAKICGVYFLQITATSATGTSTVQVSIF